MEKTIRILPTPIVTPLIMAVAAYTWLREPDPAKHFSSNGNQSPSPRKTRSQKTIDLFFD